MKRVLILGGTGAMGVHLVEELSRCEEWQVFVTSRSKHRSSCEHIIYLQGNAREDSFLQKVLQESYDVIVDFMNYGYDEFKERVAFLLRSTKHYIFLSSARVYAQAFGPIVEENARLLDTSSDSDFLATQRYALRKARQEDMLKASGYDHWTIIRPYITYSDDRLQLGIYEKEQWLYRILNGTPLVIRKGILEKKTCLTYGGDVSHQIARIMGEEKAHGQTIHITTEETITWGEILDLYLDIIKRETQISPIIYTTEYMPLVEACFEGGYNTKYDRLFDREFCNRKSQELCGDHIYMPIREGLSRSLLHFLKSERHFREVQTDFEALQNRMTGNIPRERGFSERQEDDQIYYFSEEYREVESYSKELYRS